MREIILDPVESAVEALRAGETVTILTNGRDPVACRPVGSGPLRRDAQLAASEAYSDESPRLPGGPLLIRTHPSGVLREPAAAEAAIDLTMLAGLPPAALLEREEGNGRITVDVAQVVSFRLRREKLVRRVTEPVSLPTPFGTFDATGYLDVSADVEHVAVVRGPIRGDRPTLARVHSECLTGDIFGSRRCDCGEQLHAALERIDTEGGVVVYLRGQEGRGIGLHNKLRAYHLQDEGRDTVDANLELGFPPDLRNFGVAGEILRDLGARSIRLMTNNPLKAETLILPQAREHQLELHEVVPLRTNPNSHNIRYLATKAARMGHALSPEK